MFIPQGWLNGNIFLGFFSCLLGSPSVDQLVNWTTKQLNKWDHHKSWTSGHVCSLVKWMWDENKMVNAEWRFCFVPAVVNNLCNIASIMTSVNKLFHNNLLIWSRRIMFSPRSRLRPDPPDQHSWTKLLSFGLLRGAALTSTHFVPCWGKDTKRVTLLKGVKGDQGCFIQSPRNVLEGETDDTKLHRKHAEKSCHRIFIINNISYSIELKDLHKSYWNSFLWTGFTETQIHIRRHLSLMTAAGPKQGVQIWSNCQVCTTIVLQITTWRIRTHEENVYEKRK